MNGDKIDTQTCYTYLCWYNDVCSPAAIQIKAPCLQVYPVPQVVYIATGQYSYPLITGTLHDLIGHCWVINRTHRLPLALPDIPSAVYYITLRQYSKLLWVYPVLLQSPWVNLYI